MHLLDSSALIEVVRNSAIGREIFGRYGSEDLATTVLSIHELLIGQHGQSEILSSIMQRMKILDYDFPSAVQSSKIQRELLSKGQMINQMDILIAGICVVYSYVLITLDRDFSKIQGLQVHTFTPSSH